MNASIKVAALVALLSSPAAFAQAPDLAKLDANSDGTITKEEAKANPELAAKFDELDTDKNGSLSQAEVQADAKSRWEKRKQ